MKSSSYSPYIRDHGSRIWSTYGSSIDVFFTIFPMNWRTRRATLANSSASRSHRQPKYMHQNVSICQTSAAICAAIRELNRRGLLPSAILRRLATYSRKNRLYFAFRELGRAVRTDFLLRYLSSVELRRVIQAATNKSEHFNRYAQWVAFGSSGLATAAERDEQRKMIKIGFPRWIGVHPAQRVRFCSWT